MFFVFFLLVTGILLVILCSVGHCSRSSDWLKKLYLPCCFDLFFGLKI